MYDFIHLHNHTDYSLLDGALKIDDMVKRASELGMRSIAITDHGNMFGAINFYEKCNNSGIKPIIGCEFYEAEGSRKIKTGTEFGNKYYHLILLAKNYTGYKNLMKLVSAAYTEGFYYKPRIDFELLSRYSEGLICSSACIAGIIPRMIINNKPEEALKKAMEYRDLFGKGNYYLELQDHGIPDERKSNKGLIEISKKTGIPLIATNDIHYLKKENSSAQEILICIGTQKTLSSKDRLTFYNDQFYLKSKEEMNAVFKDVPEAIRNSLVIDEMCDLKIEFPGPILPEFKIPPQFADQTDYLKYLTYEGLKKRYKEITPEITARTNYELETIISLGYTGYFLIVWDFINYAKEHDIPVGPGRGSGAGSIVAYCMRITDIDPLKYNLLFERFLNKERVSLPDFDVDFCNEGRQEVINYVTKKYGEEKVGQIITFGTLKPKAVLKDVARVLDIPFSESNAITKLIPDMPHKKATISTMLGENEKYKNDPEYKKIPELSGIPELKKNKERGGVYERLFRESEYLENMNRHASLHAAGIVIGKEELSNYVPLYKGAKEDKANSIATQYTMDKLEQCGLVKMDFLGLKTLDIIKNTENLIRKRGIKFRSEDIPEDDKETFEMMGAGKSVCVFQFESEGMQKILRMTKPASIEDLIALNALYRPGPMDNIPQFANCKNGKEKIKYPHPDLEPVLKNTYGVIVYQEQVMQVVQIIGGFSLGKADILRRAMSKKKVDVLSSMRTEFIAGAKKRGYNEKTANTIFDLLIPFSGYGFNKSHAAAYSVLAYRTAYLKNHYPAEFMAANLTNEIGNPSSYAKYLAEAKILGLTILPPDINISEKFFTVSKGKIVYGLQGIKDTGSAVVEEIMEQRKREGSFKSFTDFLSRVDLRIVNKRVLEALIKAGVFDSIEKRRATLFYNSDKLSEYFASEQEKKKLGQISLFGAEENYAAPIEMESVPEWSLKERLDFEKEKLGFYVSGHPLDKYKSIYEKYVNLKIVDIGTASPDRKYLIIGLVKNIRNIRTRKNDFMAVLSIETFESDLSIVLFPKVWKDYKHMIAEESVLAFSGKADDNSGNPQLIAESVQNIDELAANSYSQVHFLLDNNFSMKKLEELREYLLDHGGKCSVFFHMKDKNHIAIKANSQLRISSEITIPEKADFSDILLEMWKE